MVDMWRPALLLLLIARADGDSLNDRIAAAIGGFSGSVSVFAKNLDSGATFDLHADDRVRTASTIKLAILAATFAAVAENRIQWTDLATLHDSDKTSGSGLLTREFSDGDRLTIASLAHLMIVVSDNTATNLILDRISADYVNAQMDKLGLKDIRVMRKIFKADGVSVAGRDPNSAFFGNGAATPRELVVLLEKIERGEVVSAAASAEMISILKRQQDHTGIARILDVPVANKPGALDHLRSDAGIVYTPKGRIAMAITCENIPQVDWSPNNPGSVMIAKLTEILVAGLAN